MITECRKGISHLGFLYLIHYTDTNNTGVVTVFENTTGKLPWKSSSLLTNCCNLVVKVLKSVLMLYAYNSSPDVYWKTRPSRQNHLELCHSNLDTLWRARYNAKPDRVIHLSCREVHIHASYKKNRKQESCDHQGIKMFLLSDKLELITNNQKQPPEVFCKKGDLRRGCGTCPFLWILRNF